MNKSLANALKFLLFLGLGFGILYYVYHQQQLAYEAECALRGVAAEDCSLIGKVISDFAGADFGWLAIVLLCFTLSNVSRALRWNMLLRNFGTEPRFINAFLTINLGYFANLGLPRIGEVVRAGTMARYENIGVEKVMGTIVVGRMIDVISIFIMTGLALFFGYDRLAGWIEENVALSDKLAGLQWILGGLALVGLLTLYLIYRFRETLAQNAIFAKIFDLIKGFGEGLQTILKLDNPLLFVVHSIVIWVMYYLMTYFCLFAFVPTADLGAVAGLVTFVAGGWGIVVPSPGGMGSYHFMTQAALTLYGVAGDDAFSWTNIAFFTINLGCNVSIGLLALLVLPRINKDYDPQPTNG
ncbi:MAG: lysylphosphatidylglycerol synthase transmembrane domain-containing protein [Bacteroidota bacterium]